MGEGINGSEMEELVSDSEWGWRKDKGSWFQRHGEAYRKERSVRADGDKRDWKCAKRSNVKEPGVWRLAKVGPLDHGPRLTEWMRPGGVSGGRQALGPDFAGAPCQRWWRQPRRQRPSTDHVVSRRHWRPDFDGWWSQSSPTATSTNNLLVGLASCTACPHCHRYKNKVRALQVETRSLCQLRNGIVFGIILSQAVGSRAKTAR